MNAGRFIALSALAFSCALATAAESLKLNTRQRVESAPKSGDWRIEQKQVEWNPQKTALIICDMWNEHWCKGATERVAEMAPRMNEVVKAARARGVFIIHAPSDTMKFYEGTPQRKRAQEAPAARPPVELKRWCNLDPTKEAPLPIDDSDGGCDDDPQCKTHHPWKRQIDVIEVAPEDAVTDSAEAYNILQQRGIDNVIVMGVHANMCVLGRPFSIRQMVGVGKNVLLMRDMTDTMYHSRRRPFVSHFRGTDLIVEHIERYWCPSITSVDFVGGQPFAFSKDPENPKNKQTLNYSAPKPEQEGPLSPTDSLKGFKVFDDLQIEQVLAEPIVRQPLHLSWDARGRLWVVNYIQYPAPAGLTLISKDQFWRAVYDKVPPPPPKHFKGEDKITIHEDVDGDGRFDRHKTFLEGLNIVTAVEHGADGIWVLNPPYLLFFPDKNHDDVVDADPVVHLAGFGLEDTHSVANSLRWGPDGWLYGAHGSTVTANIIRPGLDEKPIAHMMGQGIWRYHPGSRRFEVFAEGGGNAFGLEIDDKGRIFSGHNGGNTRGFHYVQGGYLQKGFEKHGPLSNPYAFGYFRQMAHNDVERFTHTFVIYGGGALPEKYHGQLFGVEPLQGRVVLSDVQRDRSSFKTRDLGYAVTTTDKYFKPVDIKTGPDGALYVADWYDRQVTHTRNYEGNIDKSNGRIYRISAKGSSPAKPINFARTYDDALTDQLRSPNRWNRAVAARRLAEEPPTLHAEKMAGICKNNTGQLALEALWAYHLAEPLTDSTAPAFLRHQDPHVRLWAMRLMGDRKEISQSTAELLKDLALKEPHVEVRSQLASTAKRLPAAQAMPIVRNLLTHHEDADDIHLPLLLWWAIESKTESDTDAVLALLEDREFWKLRIVRSTILERLMKRYAMLGTQAGYQICARILAAAPGRNGNPDDRAEAKQLVRAFEEGTRGRAVGRLPGALLEEFRRAGGESPLIALRRKDPSIVERVFGGDGWSQDFLGAKVKPEEIIEVLGEVRFAEAPPLLLKKLSTSTNQPVLKAAVSALQIYEVPGVPEGIIKSLPRLNSEGQLTAFNVLASRSSWAEKLLDSIKRADISSKDIPREIVDKLRADEKLTAQVDELFGPKRELDTETINKKIEKFAATIRSGSGNPFEGYKNYHLACGACHKLFGEGGQIGPDLTSFKRDDLDTILMSIVNPSGEIREGFENVIIETTDGRNLSGFLAERYEDAVVLRGLDGESTVVKKSEITKTRSAGSSLMPEGLLDAFEDQQLRDLFAYLRSTQPLVKQR
jgi:putative heme-binding domain-containing protein